MRAAPGAISITVDTEWAHPDVLSDLLGILDLYDVTATLFCTGPMDDGLGHELAVHPNFRRGGDAVRSVVARDPDAARDDASVYRAVLAEMRRAVPEAIGSRSHSLIYDSALLPELAGAGFRYDSSYMVPLVSVEPFEKEHGIWEIPIYYMDHVDLMTGASGFRLDGLGLDRPGLKVFDFHPNMVYIDARTEAQYLASKSSYHDPDALLSYRGRDGVRSLLVAILEHARAEGLSFRTLAQVYEAASGQRADALPIGRH